MNPNPRIVVAGLCDQCGQSAPSVVVVGEKDTPSESWRGTALCKDCLQKALCLIVDFGQARPPKGR
jgi:hypothetical protein